jgi:predicted phosphoribosyltransferase
MTRFDNLADAGERLAQALSPDPDSVVLAILPNGVPGALSIAQRHGLPVFGVRLERGYLVQVADLAVSGDGTSADVFLADRPVIVVDDGVETGSAALVVGKALRDFGAGPLTLAVPVCPREGEATLTPLYDAIVAIERPMVRRSLRWHYTDFDVLDESEALRRLAAHPSSLG